MVNLNGWFLLGVERDSGSSADRKHSLVCPECGSMSCPICGSPLIELAYKGNKPDFVALAKRDDFYCFLGCKRVDLHNKTVNGVNYRGKVFVRTIFKSDVC